MGSFLHCFVPAQSCTVVLVVQQSAQVQKSSLGTEASETVRSLLHILTYGYIHDVHSCMSYRKRKAHECAHIIARGSPIHKYCKTSFSDSTATHSHRQLHQLAAKLLKPILECNAEYTAWNDTWRDFKMHVQQHASRIKIIKIRSHLQFGGLAHSWKESIIFLIDAFHLLKVLFWTLCHFALLLTVS